MGCLSLKFSGPVTVLYPISSFGSEVMVHGEGDSRSGFLHQVVQSYKNGKISLEDVPQPACKAGGVLVRTVASLISVGTEKLMIEMGRKSLLGKARARPDLVRQAWAKARKEGLVSVFKEAMSRLDEPAPLGY